MTWLRSSLHVLLPLLFALPFVVGVGVGVRAILVETVPACARPAVLVRVIDGDTWILDVDLEFDVHTHVSIREEGLSAPEPGTPEGQQATAAIVARFAECRGQIAVVSTGHRSFARWVGKTYLCGERVGGR